MEYNAKKELYHFVDRLRIDWGVTSYEQPFNAIEMSMYHAEIIYHTFDTDGFCGAAFTGNRIDTIVLNDTRSSYEQNFDCGHEIIHLTKHRDRNGGIFQCFSESQDSYLEWEANEGAAQLLVPYQDFIPRFLSCLQSRTASQHNHSFYIRQYPRGISRLLSCILSSYKHSPFQFRLWDWSVSLWHTFGECWIVIS